MSETFRLLRAKMVAVGITQGMLADKLNMSRATLCSRMGGKSEFTAREIRGIVEILGLTKEETFAIFFTE